jgi:hypothetical protein
MARCGWAIANSALLGGLITDSGGDNVHGDRGRRLGAGMSTTDPGGRDAVRERVMQRLRAGIRERQMRGESLDAVYVWIDHQRMDGTITEEEAAIAELVVRHYTTPDAARKRDCGDGIWAAREDVT